MNFGEEDAKRLQSEVGSLTEWLLHINVTDEFGAQIETSDQETADAIARIERTRETRRLV
jgi:hypothetical protein